MTTIEDLKITRMIQKSDLRGVCMANEYYTRGDTDEYDTMLHNAGVLTDERLRAIATDIYNHSDVLSLCDRYGGAEDDVMAGIVSDILKASYTVIDVRLEED